MKRGAPKLGQVNFRLDPELHQELLEIAGALGIDMSSLLKEMIKDALPSFSKRAADAVAKQHASLASRVELLLGLLREPDTYSRWAPPPTWSEAWEEQLRQLRELKERAQREREERERAERGRAEQEL